MKCVKIQKTKPGNQARGVPRNENLMSNSTTADIASAKSTLSTLESTLLYFTLHFNNFT